MFYIVVMGKFTCLLDYNNDDMDQETGHSIDERGLVQMNNLSVLFHNNQHITCIVIVNYKYIPIIHACTI